MEQLVNFVEEFVPTSVGIFRLPKIILFIQNLLVESVLKIMQNILYLTVSINKSHTTLIATF